jgi:hypothetical protein
MGKEEEESRSIGMRLCKECGKKISEERLKALPETTLCCPCKEKGEKEEKRMNQGTHFGPPRPVPYNQGSNYNALIAG